ncbi:MULTISPECIES: hypothetical protein [Pseudomonas]|uniref:Uncharacterized protein n=1 Tax=Pseudomonas rhodesiae TaxID=76760 RepID=A0A8I1DZU1_9PSED|nr:MULTISPECIES: hypothetical protein [Pseudomonas]MBI6605774.1 hypothetical protein [Pseudomonas sp. S4_EA_1b]MBI6622508.1 hypothetical protein [Pseudomonas rhodesiae]NMY77596.1 hypothetical protein [Pseudomonas rhodesiae]
MTQPTDPLADLAGALSQEYADSRDAQRKRAVAELEQVIQRVPEQTEFTNSRRYKVRGPLFLLISLALLGFALHRGSTGLGVCAAVMAVVFVLLTWQHRNAGQHAFMRLTRRQLFVDTLSAPVDLVDIVDVSISEEGWLTVQKLILRADAPLPVHRSARQLFGNQALALKKPQPQIRIQSAGLMQGGRTLDCDQIAEILNAYCQAAHAQRHLDALRQEAQRA